MKSLVIWAAAAIGLSAGGMAFAADAKQLLKQKNCLACHAPDKKLVGPAYKDVAAKYKSRKDAQAYLADKIQKGSTGVWGPVPMPPNATVNAGDAKTLAAYILKVK